MKEKTISIFACIGIFGIITLIGGCSNSSSCPATHEEVYKLEEENAKLTECLTCYNEAFWDLRKKCETMLDSWDGESILKHMEIKQCEISPGCGDECYDYIQY